MRARGRTPTDGCVQFGWEVEEKCYELLHDKNSNWDWSHFSELCLTVCLIILYLYPSVITSLALEYKIKFIEVVDCFTFLWGVPLSSEALKTGVTSTRSTRIPLLDKRSERCDLKKKKCGPSHLLFENTKNGFFGDADSLRYPASLTS